MILVDTAIWIDHLHRTEPDLVQALSESVVCTHPMVVGELALGSIRNRQPFLELLASLPFLTSPTLNEVLHLIDQAHLFGRGLSLVDVYLLAAVRMHPGTRLWTRDRRLHAAAEELGVGW